MAQDPAFQKQIQRIGELVEQLEASSDPNSRATAKDLVESLMALHGTGIERILTLASETGEAGAVILGKCANDELVSSLLLLYGLHPEDLPTRVRKALEKSRKSLEKHSASAELVSITEEGVVTVQLHAKASGCGTTAGTLRATLEAALQDAAPDAVSIVVEEPGAVMRSGFVSLAQLESGQAMAALSHGASANGPAAAPRSGD
jgi:Fe-S cluster biogenesis protein NfuA